MVESGKAVSRQAAETQRCRREFASEVSDGAAVLDGLALNFRQSSEWLTAENGRLIAYHRVQKWAIDTAAAGSVCSIFR